MPASTLRLTSSTRTSRRLLQISGWIHTRALPSLTAYDHVLHWPAPYPFWSLPVLLGTVGGLGLLVGSAGLLWIKGKMDREPASQRSVGMDVRFLVLLALRTMPTIGTMLIVHLGIVVALFLTLPYGKFVHAVYRYASLIRCLIEHSGEGN